MNNLLQNRKVLVKFYGEFDGKVQAKVLGSVWQKGSGEGLGENFGKGPEKGSGNVAWQSFNECMKYHRSSLDS